MRWDEREGTGGAGERKNTHMCYNPKAAQPPSKREGCNILQQCLEKAITLKSLKKQRRWKEVQFPSRHIFSYLFSRQREVAKEETIKLQANLSSRCI